MRTSFEREGEGLVARMYYGYQMVEGKIIIHQEEADCLVELYENYLKGDSLTSAGEKASIDKPHGSLGRLLKNKVYLGNSVYPMLISQETFQRVQEERQERSKRLGRNFELAKNQRIIVNTFNWCGEATDVQNPIERAENIYQLIEVVE